MDSRISRSVMRILASVALAAFAAFGAAAQEDPDPNSPTPILVTEATSTRAIARPIGRAARKYQVFFLNTKVILTVANLQLLDGEGGNAFRVYAEDSLGHEYRFPVVDIVAVPNSKKLFSIIVSLTDELGYWDPPMEDGDIALYLTWRGVASNRVRLGLGRMGGGVKDDPNSQPMPLTKALDSSKDNGRSIGPNYAGYRWSGDRMRFLEEATFGPTTVLDSQLRRTGLRPWLESQFNLPYNDSLTFPYPAQPLKPANAPANCDNEQTVTPDVPVTCFRDTYRMYQPQTWFFKEALYGNAQLRHRVAWALAQLWVTSGVDVQQGRHIVEYHKVLASNAFGNFRDIMGPKTFDVTTPAVGINTCSSCGMTLHPTMGDYLSMALSTKNNPNENYAREIMQLFTIGLFMLNPDGTLQTDGQGNPIPTYDQNTVNNLTKVLTGWTYCNTAARCPNLAPGSVNYIDPMILNSNNTDLTAKTLLDYPGAVAADRDITACPAPCTTDLQRTTYAQASMIHALDNIFYHPNLGPYVSRVLIQHLVTSDPSSSYVSRVAAVFNVNRTNPTQMKEVIKAILLDPEARGDVKTDPHFGKLREPVIYATNFLRAFGVRSANGLSQSDGYLTGRSEFMGMAQIPFLSPTVFNFYPPGYIIPGTSTPGPEFAIMNTGTSIQRANFINQFVFTAIPIQVNNPDAPNGTSLDFSDLQALSAADSTGGMLVDELNRRLLHGTMTTAMRNTILTAVTNFAATDTLNRSRQALYLVATSSQYQVQR